MDQQDTYFCYEVRRNGGTIYTYQKPVISVLPIGRKAIGNLHYLPIWRLYLFSRNTLTLFLQEHKITFLFSFIMFTGLYSITSILSGNPNLAIRATLYGIEDAIKGKLGITDHLTQLSDERFKP